MPDSGPDVRRTTIEPIKLTMVNTISASFEETSNVFGDSVVFDPIIPCFTNRCRHQLIAKTRLVTRSLQSRSYLPANIVPIWHDIMVLC